MSTTWTCGCTTYNGEEEGINVQWVEQFDKDGKPEVIAFGTYCTPCYVKGIESGWLFLDDPENPNNKDFFSEDAEQ